MSRFYHNHTGTRIHEFGVHIGDWNVNLWTTWHWTIRKGYCNFGFLEIANWGKYEPRFQRINRTGGAQ